jgi:oligopeptide/dipeptide ABC transporter ATP-binding protein
VVESADAGPLYARPLHPYTIALLRSAPRLSGEVHARLPSIRGAPPDPMQFQGNCAFAPRCDFVQPRCYAERPLLSIRRDPAEGRSLLGRRCACFELERVEIARAAGEIP